MKAHGSLTSSSSLREVRVAIAEAIPAFRDWTSDCEKIPAVSPGYHQGLPKLWEGSLSDQREFTTFYFYCHSQGLQG